MALSFRDFSQHARLDFRSDVEHVAVILVHQRRAAHNRVGHSPCEATEAADSPGVRKLVIGDPPFQRSPEVNAQARVAEVDASPLRRFLDACSGKLGLHLVCDDLHAGTADRWQRACDCTVEDDFVKVRVRPDALRDVFFRHGGTHVLGRHAGVDAAVGQCQDELAYIVGAGEAGHDARGADHEVEVLLHGQADCLMCLKQTLFHQLGDGIPREPGAVKRFAEHGFARLRRPDVTGHLDCLVEQVRLAGLQVGCREDALGRGVAHFGRRDNVIVRPVDVDLDMHARGARRREKRQVRAFRYMGFRANHT